MSQTILEVFGQFAVELESGAVLFKTEAEAKAALSEFENGAEQRNLASDFCAHMASIAGSEAKAASYKEKAAKGKSNVIVSFLAWVDAGQPGIAEAKPEAESTETTEDAGTGDF
jgi:hypothetical protein